MTILAPYDIVIVSETCADEAIRGKRGFIIGEVTPEQVGVLVCDVERVWCLHPDDVIATGEIDAEARDARRVSIRINSKGEVVG